MTSLITHTDQIDQVLHSGFPFNPEQLKPNLQRTKKGKDNANIDVLLAGTVLALEHHSKIPVVYCKFHL
jgi:hypothetical protein